MGLPLRLNPGPLSIGYGLDSLYDILSLWAAVWLGRRLGDLVAGYGGFNAVQAKPAESEAEEVFSSPVRRLLTILAAIGAGTHNRVQNFWHALTPAFKDLPSRSLAPVFAGHALFCAILFLAYQDMRLEIILNSFEKDFYEAIDVMVTVAYLASLLAGAVLGRWRLLTIALVGEVIAFLEPLLLNVPTTVLCQISGATLSIKAQPLHYVCEFLSCMGFSWLGMYLSTMARKTTMPIASESSKN